MNRTVIYKIHLWLSIPLGILITLICLSGAILVFKNEIRDALGMPRVVAHAGKHAPVQNGSAKRKIAPHAVSIPASRAGTTTEPDFFSLVTRFHKSLLMGSVGKVVVTYTTLFFFCILISGVWLCWPRNGRQWRQRFHIETSKGRRKWFYDLHVGLGYYALIWIAMLAVTGIAFGLHLLPRGTSIMKVFHEIHVGTWGGLVTQILTFVASLIGASLPLTGYYLYFRRRAGKKP